MTLSVLIAIIIVIAVLKGVRGFAWMGIMSVVAVEGESDSIEKDFRQVFFLMLLAAALTSVFFVPAFVRGFQVNWDNLSLSLLGMGIAVSLAMIGWQSWLYWSKLRKFKKARWLVVVHFVCSLTVQILAVTMLIQSLVMVI